MSAHANPNLITNDIVILIDASNPKCMTSGIATGKELVGKYTLQGLSESALTIGQYQPSDGGNPSTAAVDFANDQAKYAFIDDDGQFDFRGEISWMCVACKENSSNRQSIWAAIEDPSPWDGAGLVSYSHDSNGKLAWWSGSNNGSWWDTSITIPVNKWVWTAGTWSGTTQKVWAKWDGVSMQTDSRTSHSFSNPTDQSNGFCLGDNGTSGDDGGGSASQIIDGAIALVVIWKKALSEEEVMQNFKAIKSRFGL